MHRLVHISSQTLPKLASPILAESAEFTGTKWLLSFGGRRETPTNDLRQKANAMNLFCRDAARDNHLPTLAIFGPIELRNGFRGSDLLVCATVVSDPDGLVVRDPKINAYDSASISSFELSQPLMRNVEIPNDRNCEHSA